MPRLLDRGRLRAALRAAQKEARLYPSLEAAKALQVLLYEAEALDAICREVNMSYEKGKETSD